MKTRAVVYAVLTQTLWLGLRSGEGPSDAHFASAITFHHLNWLDMFVAMKPIRVPSEFGLRVNWDSLGHRRHQRTATQTSVLIVRVFRHLCFPFMDETGDVKSPVEYPGGKLVRQGF